MQMPHYLKVCFGILFLSFSHANMTNASTPFGLPKYTYFVDPFIGTGGHGHTFPGPTMPFGMVQLSPDTRLSGWDGCSGYHYSDSIIYGFSHTHLSGTGVSDYGDILIMPAKGIIDFNKIKDDESRYDSYKSSFKKDNEEAAPGYYSVFLDKPQIKAEMTCTYRTGIHRYTVEEGGTYSFVIDLKHRDKLLQHKMTLMGNMVSGYRVSEAWAKEQHVYFYAECSKTATSYNMNQDQSLLSMVFELEAGDTVQWRVGISPVDIQGAKNNLNAEAHHWKFENYRRQAGNTWNMQLGKIEATINGVSPTGKFSRTDMNFLTKFYTAFYHSMIAPNVFSDVDGRYRALDQTIKKTDPNYPHFSVFSLWDTFRAAHPLFTLTHPIETKYFIQSFERHFNDGGQLPVWELAGNYTGCMIGYHSVSVIADAAMKGLISKATVKRMLPMMIASADSSHLGIDDYRSCAYIPSDAEHESVSKTLEYAYDDWCIAQCAKLVGVDSVYQRFIKRAQYYKNIFDPATGFMTPKLNGGWREGFDPKEVNFNFTEANSWQYSYFVPHDLDGLFELHGGKAQFEAHLDKMFTASSNTTGRQQADITGLIGQYAHGNEPSHHVAFLYHYLGRPDKTTKRVNTILDSLYTIAPDGLSGNEDCGQMSAWFVMASMGLYQVNPGDPNYVLMPSIFDKVRLNDGLGNSFSIETKGNGSYVKSLTIDGKKYPKSHISHKDLIGKNLVYDLSSENSNWGVLIEHAPKTSIPESEHIVPNPYLVSEHGRAFKDDNTIQFKHVDKNAKIYYRLNESEPALAEGELTITDNANIKFWAEKHGEKSKIESAEFVKQSHNYSIEYKCKFNNQYNAGGEKALIDGIRGNNDFRTDNWQGFYNQDFHVIVDLKKKRRVTKVTVGALQDIKSWIWFPESVAVFTSKNGKRWKQVAGAIDETHKDQYGSFILDYEMTFKKRKAKYVKVFMKNPGPNPDWHLGAGNPTWLFVDEIIVE